MMLRRDLLLGCTALALTPALAQGQSASGTLSALYAGSLVNVMEHGFGPAFEKAGHGRFQGYGGGSNKVANEIKGQLRRGDVFISANPKVNDDLTGEANGDWVSWYVTFAQSPLVIGYNSSSRFAADLASKPWYQVLQQPGIKIGRTDPKLDPKGRLTVELMAKAAQVYAIPDLARTVLGTPDNPAQVLPEENLVGRLQAGQLDVGFFYSTETSDLAIPAIALPPEVALGARYTATVLRDAPNPAGAAEFVALLLGAQGHEIMRKHGLDALPATIVGDAEKIPAGVRAAVGAMQ